MASTSRQKALVTLAAKARDSLATSVKTGAHSLFAPQQKWAAAAIQTSDLEFLPAAIEIIEQPPSPIGSAVVLLICGFFAVALGFAYFGHIDIIATAHGKFQPAGRIKLIQPLETGKVAAIETENGQFVTKGQPLVELDVQQVEADLRQASAMAQSYAAEAIRRRSEMALADEVVNLLNDSANVQASAAIGARLKGALTSLKWPAGTDPMIATRESRIFSAEVTQLRLQMLSFEAQASQKEIELKSLQDTVEAQRQLIATLQTRVDAKTTLFAANVASKANVIDATETLQVQKTALVQQIGQIAQAKNAVAMIRADMARTLGTFLSDSAQKLGEAQRKEQEFSQQAIKATSRLENATLRSPIDGTVQSSTVTSIGQVVAAGEEVMRVVPVNAPLEIECYLPNRDIGFVKEGQHAIVKVEAYPFTRYGTINAVVVRVGRDAVPESDARQQAADPSRSSPSRSPGGAQIVQNLVFPVTLRVEREYIDIDGAKVNLSPGMAVTAEIRTGSRQILEYLLSPLSQTVSESMKER